MIARAMPTPDLHLDASDRIDAWKQTQDQIRQAILTRGWSDRANTPEYITASSHLNAEAARHLVRRQRRRHRLLVGRLKLEADRHRERGEGREVLGRAVPERRNAPLPQKKKRAAKQTQHQQDRQRGLKNISQGSYPCS